MAYHNSTPASVLNAPTQTVIYLVENKHMNRAERRHVRSSTGANLYIPKQHQMQPLNETYVKPVSE